MLFHVSPNPFRQTKDKVERFMKSFELNVMHFLEILFDYNITSVIT